MASPTEVLLEEPGKPPRVLNWTDLTLFEPSISSTLTAFIMFLAFALVSARYFWDFATSIGGTGMSPWNELVALSLAISFTVISGSILVARTQWVELGFPGRRGVVYFPYRVLERLGAKDGLKTAQKVVGMPIDAYLVEKLGAPGEEDKTKR
jgi:hypothetical protein